MRGISCFAAISWIALVSGAVAEKMPLVSINTLSEVYYDEETGAPKVPPQIRELDGKRCAIAGYMVPYDDLKSMRKFMLMPQSVGCNFCKAPALEEVVFVMQAGDGPFPFRGEPLAVEGTLSISVDGEDDDHGFLYSIEGARIQRLEIERYLPLFRKNPLSAVRHAGDLLELKLHESLEFPREDREAWQRRHERILDEAVGGWADAAPVLEALGIPCDEKTRDAVATYLAGWSAAVPGDEPNEIVLRRDLNLAKERDEKQVGRAGFDYFLRREMPESHDFIAGGTTLDERLARAAVRCGLRQSFVRFYESRKLVDPASLQVLRKPWHHLVPRLPRPWTELGDFLLIESQPFVDVLYESERFESHLEVFSEPPSQTSQILRPGAFFADAAGPRPEALELPTFEGFSVERPDQVGAFIARCIARRVAPDAAMDSWEADRCGFVTGGGLSAPAFVWRSRWSEKSDAELLAKALERIDPEVGRVMRPSPQEVLFIRAASAAEVEQLLPEPITKP